MLVDKKKITSLCQKSPTAKAILELLAPPISKNNKKITYIDTIEAKLKKNGVWPARQEVISIFRILDDAGCGKCIRGVNERRSRMEWSVKHTSLAELILANDQTTANDEIESDNASVDAVAAIMPSAPPAQPRQGSLRNLDLIHAGMTHAEVVALLGCDGGMPAWNQPKEIGYKRYAWGDEQNRWVYFVTFDPHAVVVSVHCASID